MSRLPLLPLVEPDFHRSDALMGKASRTFYRLMAPFIAEILRLTAENKTLRAELRKRNRR